MSRRHRPWSIAVVGLAAATPAVHAQAWTADLYAGGTRYDALAGRVSTTNLIAALRFQTPRSTHGFLSVAAPLDGDAAVWGAAGGTTRLQRHTLSGFNYGIELSAEAYAFRDPGLDETLGGGSGHGTPFVALARAFGTLELRGGLHQHAFSYADTSGHRGVVEVAARGTKGFGPTGVQLDARWLHAREADYPYVGVQLVSAPAFGRVWAWTGKWLGEELDDAVWGVGGSIDIPRAGELWATVRQDAADPLYQNSARRSWNVGFSLPLGGSRTPPRALAPKIARGAVQLRLPATVVPGDNGASPSVAGEFNEWKPAPMRREKDEWVLDLPLGAGVYRFAFVTAGGEWFVPEGYPGRMDDGMGGHIAIIVVP